MQMLQPMSKIVFLATLALLGSVDAASAATVVVSTAAELQSAVNTANSAGGGVIQLNDGVYKLTDTLYINAANIKLIGRTESPDKVVIEGDAMSSTAAVANVLRVAGSNFELSGITVRKSKWHLIQIVGENNADSPYIHDCILMDAYEQMIKVSWDAANPSVTSDNGRIENCRFEYSAGIGPQYYIGGIDAHGSKNWIVRGNVFRSIISPSNSVAEFAIHFWDQSENNLVERNQIINCDRGIGFGLEGGRGNTGGVIRNNMIYHAANSGAFADVGIALAESPDTQVYNNTVYMENSFPWAIEYRFSQTQGVLIANNLTNRPIQARDGASGILNNNVANATSGWFKTASSGDLHLVTQVPSVVDMGRSITGLTTDYDGQARPTGSGIDIGADEFAAMIQPMPPSNLIVN